MDAISPTFEASQLERSRETSAEQPENMDAISVTQDVWIGYNKRDSFMRD